MERDELIAISKEVLSMPDIPMTEAEDIFRIDVAGLPWDIACKRFEPVDPARIPRGPDGKQIGVYMLHGGAGDHRGMEPLARLLVSKLGYRVVAMTYPGKFYFKDPSRDWPGDTINGDGTARTPLWTRDSEITPDQYEIVEDRSDRRKFEKWGTLFFLKAKEGTDFHARMAAWPWAFEEAIIACCNRHFPADDYTIYAHGHSTGGPFIHMMLQRVANVGGLLGTETSPFGFIFGRMVGMEWHVPFNYLTIRTWRHIAKYAGSENPPEALRRLPVIMEEVLNAWAKAKREPQFKAEYFVTYAATAQLGDAARATAARMGMGADRTAALVERFQGYSRELSGPGTRPVPPLLYGITLGSRDHTKERYEEIVLPALAAMTPAPKARLVRYMAGVHGYSKPEADLPRGVSPVMIHLWNEAIQKGYYLR